MSSLAEEVTALSEQLAEYRSVVADVVRLLGHSGDSPDDLRDAVGQLERLIAGEDLERPDLTGLAEEVRCRAAIAAEIRHLIGHLSRCIDRASKIVDQT